ncbi:MAG: DUF86 domain-containing protein [Nanoarchaeota archaeon]|nr:DUF86 domain-containing protein [Nanoarchaeota archaeon]MBU1703767.1 DUF86 domain-containing protein [Nanoarchaeota archaeon]
MDNERIKDKISEIEEYLSELESIKPNSFEEYKNDIKEKAACERYFEKIIEAAIDLGYMVIRSSPYPVPKDDGDLFNTLRENNIIGSTLCIKLKEAKGMRNFISHQYGRIDDELVFESIMNEMPEDIKAFIRACKTKANI